MPRLSSAVAPVRDAIRDRIVTSAIPPGQRLVERSLADDLGVSRVPVREALRQLVGDGFVAERPTGGMVARQYSDAEIDELVAVNAALESIVVRRWVDAAADVALGHLDDALDAAASALAEGDQDGIVRANADFHAALTQHAPHGIARELLASIGPRLRWLQRQHADGEAMHADHVELVAALRDRDADAAVALIGRHAVASRAAARNVGERP